MPVGTGSATLQTIPSDPYVVNPDAFQQMTNKEVLTPINFALPGPGARVSDLKLLQAGIVSKLTLKFVGQLVVAGGAVTTSSSWPYAVMSEFVLAANGQNELWFCSGNDLKVLRFLRNPAYNESTDTFPDVVGGGGSIANGTYPIELTWEVPIAMDDYSLIASLFSQSSSTNLTLRFTQALNTDLFSAAPANATLSGTVYVQETLWQIPYDDKGNMVIPDLTRLHGFNAVNKPLNNVGDAPTALVRSAGQLERLFVSVYKSAGNRLSAAPNAAASNKIDRISIQYGGNKTPLKYDPASFLLGLNNQQYGSPLPYDRLCFDFVRENPVRDVFLLQALTELNVVPTINSAVSLGAGSMVRLVQETLF